MTARIGGAAANLDAAVQASAALLGKARQPLVAGLATDVAGVTAAVELARRLRGVVDHAHSAALLRDLDVMRRPGWIITTPLEARARADLVLLAGPGLEPARPELRLVLDAVNPPYLSGVTRRVIRLCPEGKPEELTAKIAALRMLLAGRSPDCPQAVRDCAEALRAAGYSVVGWSAAHLNEVAVATLCGLVEQLNAKTRAAGLPLPPEDNAAGAAQAAAWLTGYPLPVGFGRGVPEHDPLRLNATRLAESGESGAAIWIMASGTAAPPWQRELPVIALAGVETPPAPWLNNAAISITVGRPGIDHDSVMHDARLGGLTVLRAGDATAAPSVASVLDAISAALPTC